MMRDHMLTTADNPFDPFTQYKEWEAWDASHGYHTPSYLARIVRTSEELSPGDQAWSIEQAIDEIVQLNITGNYRKVTKEVTIPRD
jgi:hypothetical protein